MPSNANSPNVIPAAASAIASGSSRRRFRNTISNVTAITSRTATSRPAIDPVIVVVSSLRTTGTPVTVYRPPYADLNIGILIAWRIQLIACACCASDSDDRRRIWTNAEFAFGNRYANRALGWLTPRVWSNTIAGMNCVESIDGSCVIPESNASCSSD